MKTEDIRAFGETMIGLTEIFAPTKEVSKEKTELYFAAFADWSIEQFKKACFNLINMRPDNVFPIFPTPAEIRRYLDIIKEDDILEKWLYIESLIPKYGHAMSLILPDPVLMTVIDILGGWARLATTATAEMVWTKKEFIRLYPMIAKRKVQSAYILGAYDAKHNMIDLRSGKQLSIEEAEKAIRGSDQLEGPDDKQLT